MMNNIIILGSTGSIGTQTLEVVKQNSNMKVVALTGGSNIDLLEQQAREFQPNIVCLWDTYKASELKTRLKDQNIKVVAGMDGLIECATLPLGDIVVTAIVGMIGIRPTIEAIRSKKNIALANKETLVTAGHIIMPLVKEMGVKILPVDSEHSAIYQSLQGEDINQVDKVILTASGGPFRGKKQADLQKVQLEDALKHPNWTMGRKITIDSATLANKGLEVIEAKWLFQITYDQIEVLVHPESIIHSMVQYVDGGIIAQLGTPDMKLPIQYALTYPDRRPLKGERINFCKLGHISFEEADYDTFPNLKLAYQVGRLGGSMPTVYNAANEKAVAKFLNREISFLEISKIIEYTVNKHNNILNPTISQILDVEKETYDLIESRW